MQALIYRAKEINAISEQQAKQLFMQINKAGWKKREPAPIPSERPSHLENMIKLIMQNQGLSLEDIASLLQTKIEDLPQWYDGILDGLLPRTRQIEIIPSS